MRTALPFLLLGLAVGCGERRETATAPLALLDVRYGKTVDVYAASETAHGPGFELLARDVFVAGDAVVDGQRSGTLRVAGTNPDTLNERVVLTCGAAPIERLDAMARLTNHAPSLSVGGLGAGEKVTSVPRDSVFELRFDRPLPGGQGFCATLDSNGAVTGLSNPHAARLVARTDTGERVIPARLVVRGDRLLVDPVVVGSEAQRWQLPENGSGLPPAPEGAGPNLELRLAVTGPLALPGLQSPDRGDIVIPFRSGNGAGSGGGMTPAAASLRLVGALTMYLEKVEDVDPGTQEVTLFKNGLAHDIDDGDVIRLFIDNSGIPVVITDVLADPLDDRGLPAVGHVRALVTRTVGLRENDPRRLPGYPSNPRSPAGERWLAANAPRAVLDAEFAAERRIGSGPIFGDDPRNFVRWSPTPLPNADGSPLEPGDGVSPFAGAIVRFNRAVDPATVRPLDTFFCATRDVLDPAALLQFVQQRGIDPALFSIDKFMTPHLVAGSVAAVDASGSSFRLQAPLGLYLDAAMRTADETAAFAAKRFKYFIHLVTGPDGIKDLASGQLDLQFLTPRLHIAAPFALDMRRSSNGATLFPDNHVVSVARRFATRDEDEQPSYYIADEVQGRNLPPNANAFPLADIFGAVIYLNDGWLRGRPTSRMRKVADDLNQIQPPPQSTVLRFCPEVVSGESQVPAATAAVRFGAPIQNPSNPHGARLQATWREIDLSLSRVDPFEFNLDVEQMYWGVFAAGSVVSDVFPTTSLFLGHGEYRPENCVGSFSALPTLPDSGLRLNFADNYAHNRDRAGNREDAPPPHEAYRRKPWVLDPATLVREPNNVNRYAPTPRFERPYFTWRDEQVMAQGGNSGLGSDTLSAARLFEPYIIAPFLQGQGRYVTVVNNTYTFNHGFWSNALQMQLDGSTRIENRTGGALGSIALPLLADMWVEPFGSDNEQPLPHGGNGWQIALAVQSSSTPNFRAYSGGGVVNGQPRYVQNGTPDWVNATGGYTSNGQRTQAADNSVYWTMVDFVTSKSVATSGFVDLLDPHRMPDPVVDPRLGALFGRTFPAGQKIVYATLFDPPLDRQPEGTSIVAEYRAAGVVDPQPWRAIADRRPTRPDAKNFPLDPLKAGDAHIRKDDIRPVAGQPRDWWTFPYNRNVTAYTTDPADLSSPAFIARFAGPRDVFTPDDVRYLNWRLVMTNAIDGANPASPSLDSFMLAYRFEAR